MLDPLPFPEDFLLAQKCLEGDALAIRRLQETHSGGLTSYLVGTGARVEEARLLIDELWADCLVERPGNRPRLATYAGNSPLQTWLKAVSLNKLVKMKRREATARRPQLDPKPLDDDSSEGPVVVDEPPILKAPLLEIMQRAVEAAFRECDAQDFVLVQLAHTNGLLLRELAVMFVCSEAKISRDLERARRSIAKSVLAQVRAQDEWLELRWEDFLDLCRVASPTIFGVE